MWYTSRLYPFQLAWSISCCSCWRGLSLQYIPTHPLRWVTRCSLPNTPTRLNRLTSYPVLTEILNSANLVSRASSSTPSRTPSSGCSYTLVSVFPHTKLHNPSQLKPFQPKCIQRVEYFVKYHIWSLMISLIELAYWRFLFSNFLDDITRLLCGWTPRVGEHV